MNKLLPLSALLTWCATVPFAHAGTYGPQNFNSFAPGTLNVGDGSTMGSLVNGGAATITSVQNRIGSTTDRALRLTQDGVGGINGSFKLPALDTAVEIDAFDITYKALQYSPDTLADGYSLTFGAIPGGNDHGGGEVGFAAANALVVAFDTYVNFAGDAPRIKVLANGVLLGSVPPPPGGTFPFNDVTYHTVTVHWDSAGVDVTYDGLPVFTNLAVPGFFPAPGDRFAFSGRTGGSHQETHIDDLQVTTTPVVPITTSEVVITEFVAENGDGIEDEDNDTSDWIELYNGTGSPVSLAGWRLTNTQANLGLWTVPAVTMQPFTYLRIFASGKDRAVPTGVLHTNFTLNTEGGYLALVKPDGTTKTSEFNFGAQSEDVSMGTYGQGQTVQFMIPPTPGARNERFIVEHGDGPPSEDVVFTRAGGLISGPVTLGVLAPTAPDAVIRYTLDGTVPDATDPIFNPATPLSISNTSNIRARTFQPGRLPGDVSSRSFLLLDSTLTSYGATGQPFSSNLPIVVVESWGVNIDGIANPAGARPYRPVYAVVLGPDPANGNRASLTGLVDFEGRSGMHVRGQTSSSFPQKPYAWEIWNNEDNDKSVPLLGLPSDSDWILQTPYNDKTLMRNILPYTLMYELNGPSGGVRSKFVEVFFNQDGGPVSYADYRGVFILMERIQRGTDRIDISKLSPLATDPARITGGYIFKKDKLPVSPMYTTTSAGAWGAQVHEIVEPEGASAAQVSYVQNYVQQFDNALSGPNFADPTTGYRAYIEPETFIDNHLWVEVFKQIDGYRLSTYYTKDRGRKIRAFPIWDYNLSGGNANYLDGFNPSNWYYNFLAAGDYPYYSRLFVDPTFRLKYWDRYWQLRRSSFTTANILARIDAWANELTDNNYGTNVTSGASTPLTGNEFYPNDKANNLSPSLEAPPRVENPAMRHFDRWPILGVHVWPNPAGSNTRTTFQSEVQWMKDWFTNRMAWIDSQTLRPPDFSIPGGNVPSGAQLGMTNPNPSGTIYYTSDGSDPAPTPGTELVLLVGSNESCKWLVPSSGNGGFSLTAGGGAQQWTTYTDPPNIANWTTASTGIGYDRTATPVNYLTHLGTTANTEGQMYNINQTCYIRVPFTIPDQATLDAIGTLLLSMKYDDGFRAYINGAPVLGRNDTHSTMSTNPWTAQATQIHDDAAAVVFETNDITTLGKPQLRVGLNMLAIHGLNLGLTSSDLLFSPRLTYVPVSTPTPTAQTYSAPVTLNASSIIRSRVLVGGQWGPITEAAFVVNAASASAANVVVSEFCYDPQPSGIYDSRDLEFIVLRNISPGNVDLTGVELAGAVTHSLTGTPDTLTLPPGAEAVVAANPTALVAVHGAAPAGLRIFGPFTGALNNAGETVTVRTPSGAIIKEYSYSPSAPWPDGAGRSIVLQRPWTNPDHNDGHNWRSSVATRGTPYGSDSVPFSGNWIADTDSDGFADGIEYSLGTAANSADSKPSISINATTEFVNGAFGRYLRLTFRRSILNDEGAVLPELSLSLSTWISDAFARISQADHGDGTVTEIWRSKNPVPAEKAFVRLRVTSP